MSSPGKTPQAAVPVMETKLAEGCEAVIVTHGAFTVGLLTGQLGNGPDFLEPLDAADLDLWEGDR